MEIWFQTNMKAHDFIPESYWRKNYDFVKTALPDANIFVYEENGKIQGFIGLINNYIAGIFVRQDSQSHGIGRALLNHMKKQSDALSLHVYQKNKRAVQFYQRESFTIICEQIDEATGEKELIMSWEYQHS
ncbi:N-acetyltransferase [Caproicibacter fermentans]|nr:N-acetyltransferase [Caproicibacter fermentans]